MLVRAVNKNGYFWQAIKSDWLLLLCLCISVSEFSTHAKLFVIPVFLLIASKWKMTRQCKNNVILLFVFAFFYLIPYFFRLDIGSRSDYLIYMLPPVFYLAGCYLGNRYKQYENILVVLLFAIFLMYAFVQFSYLVYSMISNRGFILEDRMVLDAQENETTSATLYALFVSVIIAGLSLIIVPKQVGMMKWVRIIGVILALLATYGMATIVTRTSILEAFIMIVFSLFMFLRNRNAKRRGLSLFLFIILIVGGIYFFMESNFFTQFVDAFRARDELGGYGSDTFGGRTVRWSTGIQDLLRHPFGTPIGQIVEPSLYGRYAHNMWIDIGLTAGWIPFIIMLVFSLRSFRQSLRLFRDKSYDYFTRLYFTAVSIIFLISCFMEPVLAAVYSHFLVYLIFCGMVSEMKPK